MANTIDGQGQALSLESDFVFGANKNNVIEGRIDAWIPRALRTPIYGGRVLDDELLPCRAAPFAVVPFGIVSDQVRQVDAKRCIQSDRLFANLVVRVNRQLAVRRTLQKYAHIRDALRLRIDAPRRLEQLILRSFQDMVLIGMFMDLGLETFYLGQIPLEHNAT